MLPLQTYLLLYTAEQYQQLARHLRAWPFPRGHFRLAGCGSMLLLLQHDDTPMSTYLPITFTLTLVAAACNVGESVLRPGSMDAACCGSDAAAVLRRSLQQMTCHCRYLTRIPFQGSEFLLADRRFCPLLPMEQREFPHPQLLIRGGRRGQSCASTCR